MKNREYKLRNAAAYIDESDMDKLEGIFEKINCSEVEAIHVGSLIYLPDKQEINDPSNLKIISFKRKKIDHTAKLENEELREGLKEYQEKFKLTQKEMQKIIGQVKKMERALSKSKESLEKLKKCMEENTYQIINDKQITNYVNNINKLCDRLTESLFLEEPSILPAKTKKEVVNKVTVLQHNIDELIKELSD